MQLSPKTTILTLMQEYPFLIDVLAEHNPAFVKLKNPILRQTMGRVATLEKAASLGKEDTLELMLFVAGRIMAVTGVQVEILPPEVTAAHQAPLSAEQRLVALKEIIRELHAGAALQELQEKFEQSVGDISPEEIAALEQALVDEGLPEAEIKQLCNLHVELFKGTLDGQLPPCMPAGHPVHTYMEENRHASELGKALVLELERMGEEPGETIWSFTVGQLRSLVAELSDIRTHYVRKENQLFPLLEHHGLEAPTKVMWEVHDDIRAQLRSAAALLKGTDRAAARQAVADCVTAVEDMIYKEERILLPMALETLRAEEWARIRLGDDEIGYAFEVEPGEDWQPPVQAAVEGAEKGAVPEGLVDLATGRLSLEVLNEMLCNLPVDMSFVDAEDKVAYYSDSSHRIFPRSPEVIGRNVRNCHPPKSVDMVTEILEKFKSGERDTAEFWLELGNRFIHIQYRALRNRQGDYLGCLEVGQDASHLRGLTGQRRLLEWK
ncbi:DUF438 domain-containing protein [Desulfogranum mediterraneum]|uniref:DUF438 domain-containing protein n=1 Tax=Desulfogranum mediterraneum TaxID=160661 RepID=UPI000491618C|nr:DUF438 domain-containing protein [Desulfogranum mediterraneum]